MFHVLEHLAQPINFLKKVKKHIKPNGRILIEIPNLDDFQIEKNSAYRDWFWQRAHLQYFSPKTLKLVLKKSGFKSIRVFGIQRYSIENMMYWKLNLKPQLKMPSFTTSEDFIWLDKYYKKYLEKNLKSDTIMTIGHI